MPQNILTYLTYSMIAALPLTISQWYIDNGAFMLIVLTLYLGDYLVGSFNHLFILNDFSIKKNYRGFLTKGFAIIAGYIFFEMIYQILKDYALVAGYIKLVIQLTVALYPAYSGLKNVSILTNGAFPPRKWFDLIEGFNRTLDPTKFNTYEKDSNNPPNPTSDSGLSVEEAGDERE